MSPELIGLIAFLILFTLMAANMPLGICMALIGFLGYATLGGWNQALTIVATSPFDNSAVYYLTVFPLFILMGEYASSAGLIRGAYHAAHKWLGQLPGGLAIATIGACGAFAAVCGSSMATAGAMTSIAYPEMKRYQYDPALSTGCIAAGGTLGILIPPSTVFIMYAVFAEESVGKLYMAGLIPGIILASLFMIVIYMLCRMRPAFGPRGARAPWKERFVALKSGIPVIIMAGTVLGGMYMGVFTPNEAAGVGVVVALVIGLILRSVTGKSIKDGLMQTITTTTMIFVILIGAMIFNYFIVLTGIPAILADFVAGLDLPRIYILIGILLVYVVLGAIMDGFAMTVLTLPIFIPIIASLGYDLVWFGVIFVMMIEMASITPPIGVNIFVVSSMVREVPMYTVFKGIMPFLVVMIISLILNVAFPEISLFLPNSMS